MARLIADEFLTDERDRKYYADHYRCIPPPLFIISITLIEVCKSLLVVFFVLVRILVYVLPQLTDNELRCPI